MCAVLFFRFSLLLRPCPVTHFRIPTLGTDIMDLNNSYGSARSAGDYGATPTGFPSFVRPTYIYNTSTIHSSSAFTPQKKLTPWTPCLKPPTSSFLHFNPSSTQSHFHPVFTWLFFASPPPPYTPRRKGRFLIVYLFYVFFESRRRGW